MQQGGSMVKEFYLNLDIERECTGGASSSR